MPPAHYEDRSSTQPTNFLSNTSIRHNSVKEDSVLEVSKIDNIPQISVGEVSIPKNRMTENSISQVNRSEVSAVETALVHFNSSKVGIDKRSIVKTAFTPTSSTKIGIIKDSFSQINPFNRSSSEISSTQIGSTQISTFQIGSFQVDTTNISPTQVNASQEQTSFTTVNTPSEVSFSNFIPFQQFFNIHNSNVVITNTFKDNPLNVTLEITDLPTGQLTEAQVTEFTDQGIPNGGKILIDHNANGLGWFIDTTPLDHSEFSQTITDTVIVGWVRRTKTFKNQPVIEIAS